MFKQIIIGLDGSDPSKVALGIACDLAKHYDSNLTLVHVPHSESVIAVGAVAGYGAVASMPDSEEIEKAGQEVLDAGAAEAAKSGCGVVETVMPKGDAAKEILALADKIGADLIVTGRRGLGSVASLMLGSTSQRISHDAECAVLTVA